MFPYDVQPLLSLMSALAVANTESCQKVWLPAEVLALLFSNDHIFHIERYMYKHLIYMCVFGEGQRKYILENK